jgi:hypothetical protein
MKSTFHVFCLVWTVVLMQACSENAESPEDEIRTFIKASVAAAENRSLDGLTDLVHHSYLDQKGYNKQQLGGLLRAYIFRHKKIYLFTKIKEIDLLAENEAAVRLYVAMAGSVISDIDAIAALRAQLYEFELQLIKEDDWLLHHASWRPASIIDFE